MIVIRGLNVFPTQIAAVLNGFEALSGEYRVVLAGQGPYDRLPLEAETATSAAPAPGLADAVTAGIKRALGVTARVTLLPFGTLPRTEGKTRRVFRGDGP
jgi:phenylacetate-CoA ligase